MKYRGNNLSADLNLLWTASVKDFPAMSQTSAEAANTVHRSSGARENHPTAFFPVWTRLRDGLQTVLGKSSTNLEDTATALRTAAAAYARQDDRFAGELKRIQQALGKTAPDVPDIEIPFAARPPFGGSGRQGPATLVPSFKGPVSVKAPTAGELLSKAKQADELQYEAELAQMNAVVGTIMGIVPKGFVEGQVVGSYKSIADEVGGFAKNDIWWYEPATDAMEATIRLNLTNFGKEIDNAKDGLHPDDWCSDAAAVFRRDFLNAYPDVVNAQAALCSELHAAVFNYQRALASAYRALDEGLDVVIAAFKGIIKTGSGAQRTVLLTGLTTVIAVAGTLATGGTATAVKFALGGAAVTMASGSLNFGGPTVDSVRASFTTSLKDIDGKLQDFDMDLASKLKSSQKQFDQLRGAKGKIEMPRPAFADNPSLL